MYFRSFASRTATKSLVARLYDGYRLVVCAEENGWAQVRAAAFTGYVKMDYIQAE